MSRLHKQLILPLAFGLFACSSAHAPEAAAPAPVSAPAVVANRPAEPAKAAPQPAPAEPAAPSKSPRSKVTGPTIEAAVNRYLTRDGAKGVERSHVIERVDLNGDSRADALVLLRSRRYCGGLGCTMLVFERTAAGFALSSELRLGRTPLIAAETRTGGWRDLVAPMTSARSGMRLVLLRHSSDGYPGDADRAPVVPPDRDVRGRVLFSND